MSLMWNRLFPHATLAAVVLALATGCADTAGSGDSMAGGASEGAAMGERMPGVIQPARAPWDTGWFQEAVYSKAIEALGYDVAPPKTLEIEQFYSALRNGDVDFWVNAWDPQNEPFITPNLDVAEMVGTVAKKGSIQGYLVDKRTAEALNITSLEDFKRDDVRAAFDVDGDGKADMVGCQPDFGCSKVIDHQMRAYGLTDYIDYATQDYETAMTKAVGRYNDGLPVFFYTWTPNWMVGVLTPARDVVWIEVPYPSLPGDQAKYEDRTEISNVLGCVDNPCLLGWPSNDIRPVASQAFLAEHPDIRKLLEVMSIPVLDIFFQNAKMYRGEDTDADIQRHAEDWIAQNRAQFDAWIAEAKAAAGGA